MDADQAAQERRTCASLRERVAARALGRFPLAIGPIEQDPKSDDIDELDPRVLAEDPDRFYATLEQHLAAAPFGPDSEPSPVSPASRLVNTCRQLGS